ncbi:kinase-like domain-containing protein [Tribonema minus]|uniref:Kinase-like domain-containing protein n=1 Tax=Tribonema minus TaxID=303371 RepID=A0A835YS30_9STRA|nr:kinase-like domain-containing protein [Tribonema minus]
MGCTQSSPSEQQQQKHKELRHFTERPNRIPAERLHGKFMAQMVREVFDTHPSEVYDFSGPVLGKGGYASVMMVKHKTTGALYAMKQIDITDFSELALHLLQNEIESMKHLVHPNIVRLQEVYQTVDLKHVYLIMDRLEGGTVREKWAELDGLEEDHAAYIASGVVAAIRYCHDRNVVHRDLKMDNVLFESKRPDSIVKIIDFGLSEKFGSCVDKAHDLVGTRLYSAPEILKNAGHGLPCDMWSIGVIVFALVGNAFPFFDRDPDILASEIKYARYKFAGPAWDGVSPLCKDFIDRCLVKNPKKRMTAPQAQEHPWLRGGTAWANAIRGKAGGGCDGRMKARTRRCMGEFQDNNLFKKVAMEVIAYILDPEETESLAREFIALDKDGDGVLSLPEFKSVIMRHIGSSRYAQSATGSLRNGGSVHGSDAFKAGAHYAASVTEEEAEAIFSALDIDHSGVINFTEFVAGCLGHRHINETTIRCAFDRLDYDRNGVIELRDMLMYVGADVSAEGMEAALRDFDTNGDGKITFDEFRSAMLASMATRGIDKAMSVRGMRRAMSSGSLSAYNLHAAPLAGDSGDADTDAPTGETQDAAAAAAARSASGTPERRWSTASQQQLHRRPSLSGRAPSLIGAASMRSLNILAIKATGGHEWEEEDERRRDAEGGGGGSGGGGGAGGARGSALQ